ncbi:hypothetical protein N7499_013062 [Penicillium canescens]|nr:hypothetical protein N7522_002323 [Penicillium canescens]KAJ6064382.1 hypothetical protein N7499_013062 [Penicillium canescens]KAJ6154120.1 hypothetical protein N7485_012489 [Penicillium canescens]
MTGRYEALYSRDWARLGIVSSAETTTAGSGLATSVLSRQSSSPTCFSVRPRPLPNPGIPSLSNGLQQTHDRIMDTEIRHDTGGTDAIKKNH